MKRLIVLLSIVGVILAAGAIAVAQAMRKGTEDASAQALGPVDPEGKEKAPPTPIADEDLVPPTPEDFRRLGSASASSPVIRGNDGSIPPEEDELTGDNRFSSGPPQPMAMPDDEYGGSFAAADHAAAQAQYQQAVPTTTGTDLAAQLRSASSALTKADTAGASQPQSTPSSGGSAPSANALRTEQYVPARPLGTSAEPTPVASHGFNNDPTLDSSTGPQAVRNPYAVAPQDGGYEAPATQYGGGYGQADAQPYGGSAGALSSQASSPLQSASRSLAATPYPGVGSAGASPSPGESYDTRLSQPGTLPEAGGYGAPQPLAGTSDSYSTMQRSAGNGHASATGTGLPGEPKLEGPQAPNLTLEKTAPAEVQVNKPADFKIRVRNTGQVAAHNVVVMDEVPKGTELINAIPTFQQQGGMLTWNLGTLEPGEEETITLQLRPLTKGAIGSVARVAFEAMASVSTKATQPVLNVTYSAQQTVLIGEQLAIKLTLENQGDGPATGVVLENDVPEMFSHPAGRELEFEVGTLRPGERREIELLLTAEQPGPGKNLLVVRGEGDLEYPDEIPITVIAPDLQVSLEGPALRFLDRQATYMINVSNPGTATANNIELVTRLPKAFRFVSTNQQGQYDQASHAVYWSLTELPAGQSGEVQVTVLPIEMGEHKLVVEATGDLSLMANDEEAIVVDGSAELQFSVADVADPIEVGSDTTYEVRITNKGSKTDGNVLLVAQLPPGLQPIGCEGPTAERIQGQTIAFEPLPRLAPGSEVVYRIRARGIGAGDQRILVKITSNEMKTPLSKEESTRVYSDR